MKLHLFHTLLPTRAVALGIRDGSKERGAVVAKNNLSGASPALLLPTHGQG